MYIIIHRGTEQIGGCITEIGTNQSRILIDFGENLPDNYTPSSAMETPKIEGVTVGKANCDAIFFTHYHYDHIGNFMNVNDGIPMYMGEIAKEIHMKISRRIYRKQPEKLAKAENIQTFKIAKKISIKDITVTPLLVDHSAYDAYMFLIEADGKRILHTGDFRMHGPRGSKVILTLEKYVEQVDALITEGTMLSRSGEKVLREYDLQCHAHQIMPKKKYVFILCSSTNIDSIASFYRANPHNRIFVCDQYQKDVLETVTNSGGRITDYYNFKYALSYGTNLLERMKSDGFCMLVRATPSFSKIMDNFPKAESLLIYSMWHGYIGDDAKHRKQEIIDFMSDYEFQELHTSGHATPEAIAEVCKTVSPKQYIIPMHSEARDRMSFLDIPSTLKEKIIYPQDGSLVELL
ncbi:MAG: MBL fold metallo-hydrolase [Syntrophomonadaceae bacterium]|jgi:ribonuclease J